MMSRFHRRFLELVVMIAILLPHTCHGSCESILLLGVKGFSFGIQETLPTEPVDILADAQRDSAVSALADDYFGALAGELSVGIACLRRYQSDSRLAVVGVYFLSVQFGPAKRVWRLLVVN